MEEMKQPAKVIYRFGHFEADPETGELSRRGQRIKIQELPFRMLVTLLEQQGQIVSRDFLAKQLWPENTFVEFDQGLSTAVGKLRQAIGDVAENPRFIETVPRRGYRFIAPVTVEGPVVSPSAATEPVPYAAAVPVTEAAEVSPAPPKHGWPLLWKLTAAAVLAGIIVLSGLLLRPGGRAKAALRANDRVVLADFENATGNGVFDDTLTSALRVKLDESPFFSLVSPQVVQAAMKQQGRTTDGRVPARDAQQICQAVHAKAVVHGIVLPEGLGLRLRLEANACGDAATLAREETVAPSPEMLLAALGKTADTLRRVLGEPESSVQRFSTPMAQATTASFSALKAFAAGEEKRVQGQDHETLADYKLATDLDPEFALAYARLGTIYSNENEAALSSAAYKKAFDLRMHTTERERLYLTAHYYSSAEGDAERALEVYKLWRQLYPQDLIAPNNLADTYETLGQPDKARLMAGEALRINPDNAFPYAGMLQADQRLGRYQEAREVWREVQARKLDNSVTSRMAMFRIGVAEGDDALVKQQLDWAAGNPREGELLMLMGWVKAASGRLREAQTTFHHAQAIALSNGLQEFAADAGEDLAQCEADFGETAMARAEVERSLKLAKGEPNVEAFAAMILADAGDGKQAEALASKVQVAAPHNTIFVKMVLPMAQSHLSLLRADPTQAVELLKPVSPYDLSRATELASIYYRAQAMLADGRGLEAAREFQRLLDLRAICPVSPYLALAHLGIARSRHSTGDQQGARAEYEAFLTLWQGADVDLPVLRRARSEYKALTAADH